jgi:hypothetical protein
MERSALDAARDMNFTSSGWCSKGQRSGDDLISEKYSLSEIPSDSYEQATEFNIRDSDGTLVFILGKTAKASVFALEIAENYQKPTVAIDLDDITDNNTDFHFHFKELAREEAGRIPEWLHKHDIKILNITCPNVSGDSSFTLFVYWFVRRILEWNDRIELCLRSPSTLKRITGGKHSCWAIHLTVDTLEGLLWAVGEFGIRLNSMRLPNGEFPDPDIQRSAGSKERVRLGLEGIAIIQARELDAWVPLRKNPGEILQFRWTRLERDGLSMETVDKKFPDDNLVFIPKFQKKLSSEDLTSWAQNLSERELATLFRMVGEYGIRMYSKSPPDFTGDSKTVSRMRAALEIINRIHMEKNGYGVSIVRSWIDEHVM